jgi:hypothetical protein
LDRQIADYLQKAAAAAKGHPGSEYEIWLDLAHAQAANGDIQGARESLALTVDEPWNGFYLKHRAIALAQVGEVAPARATAAKIKFGNDQSEAYTGIALAGVRAGNPAGARQDFAAARQAAVGADLWADWSLVEISQAQAQTGDFAGAKLTAIAIQDKWKRSDAEQTIAITQDHWGDFAAAVATANSIRVPMYEGMAWSSFVQRRIAAGDIAAAKGIAASITEPDGADHANAMIAAALAGNGDIDGARAFDAKLAKYNHRHTESQSAIAAALVGRGDLAAAKAIAAGFEDPDDQAQVLTAIGCAQARKGDAVGGQMTLRDAFAALSKMEHTDLSPWSYTAVGAAQAGIGDMDGARMTFAAAHREIDEHLDYHRYPEESQADVAAEQGTAGDLDGAPASFALMGKNMGGIIADKIHDIAKARAQAGQSAGLDRWISTLPAGLDQVAAYAGAAEGLIVRRGKN